MCEGIRRTGHEQASKQASERQAPLEGWRRGGGGDKEEGGQRKKPDKERKKERTKERKKEQGYSTCSPGERVGDKEEKGGEGGSKQTNHIRRTNQPTRTQQNKLFFLLFVYVCGCECSEWSHMSASQRIKKNNSNRNIQVHPSSAFSCSISLRRDTGGREEFMLSA